MILDGVFAIVGLYSFYTGYSRGIINTFFTVFSWFVAVVATLKFARPAQELIGMFYHGEPTITYILGLLFAFLFSLLVVRAVGRFLTEIMESANINIVNQVLGGMLSTLFFVTIFCYVVQFLDRAGIVTPSVKQESKSWPLLAASPQYTSKIIQVVTPFVSDLWKETLHFMDGMNKNGIERTESAPQIYDQQETLPPLEQLPDQ